MVNDKPMRIGRKFYFPYFFVAIIFHLFISLYYCLGLDMAEANAIVFLLKPGALGCREYSACRQCALWFSWR